MIFNRLSFKCRSHWNISRTSLFLFQFQSLGLGQIIKILAAFPVSTPLSHTLTSFRRAFHNFPACRDCLIKTETLYTHTQAIWCAELIKCILWAGSMCILNKSMNWACVKIFFTIILYVILAFSCLFSHYLLNFLFCFIVSMSPDVMRDKP